MTATQALMHYKGRDVSEKLFCADKSFLGSRSMRIQTAESLRAKLFVEFVAQIVRNRMYNLLKDTMLRMETRPNFMTVPAAIRELEKMEMVRRSGGLYRLDHAVTKRQRTILAAFGISEEDIRKLATGIGKELSDADKELRTKKQTDDTEECDAEDETDGLD